MTPQEILQDFRRRYEQTYVFVQEPGGREQNLFHVDRVEEPSGDKNDLGVINLSSIEVGRIRLNIGSAHTIKFVPPPVGVFQHGNKAVLCKRRPQKQYRRGICNDNTLLMEPVSLIDPQFGRTQFSAEVILAAFEAKQFGIKEGLELLASGKYRSVALTDGFSMCLSLSETSTDYLLFHLELPVAKVSSDGKVTRLLEAVFEKQISKVLS